MPRLVAGREDPQRHPRSAPEAVPLAGVYVPAVIAATVAACIAVFAFMAPRGGIPRRLDAHFGFRTERPCRPAVHRQETFCPALRKLDRTERPRWVDEWAEGVAAAAGTFSGGGQQRHRAVSEKESHSLHFGQAQRPCVLRGVAWNNSDKARDSLDPQDRAASMPTREAIVKTVATLLYFKGFGEELQLRSDEDGTLTGNLFAALRAAPHPIVKREKSVRKIIG